MGATRRIVVWGLAALGAVLLVASLVASGGLVVYTLDDAYIHLALAQRISEGTYGINPGEFAAPSSSIAWPFLLLLAPSGWLREALPFAIGALATVSSVRILLGLLDRTGLAEVLGGARLGAWALAALALANLVGVVFTGLEHALHIAASLAVLRGIVRLDEGEVPGPAFWVGVVAGPLLRFEGLAISGPALVLAALAGHRAGALAAGGAVVAVVGGFSAWLRTQGQALPSSVLVKLEGVVSDLLHRYASPAAWGSATFLAACTGLIVWAARRGRLAAPRTALAVVGVVVGQLVAGRYGWFGRYEVYAVLFAGFGALVAVAPALRALAGRSPRAAWALLLAALPCFVPLARGTLLTPLAVRSIATQHVPMHTFTRHFDGVVACNDLGWVAYRAPHRVLDLWGLGSEKARVLRGEMGQSRAFLEAVTAGEGVGVAIVYDTWFREVPPTWTRLGTLVSAWPNVGPDEREVAFYLVDPARRAEAEAALGAMIATLPAASRFERAR